MTVDGRDLLASLPRHARLLGVDLGTKTIGLALSDVERCIASPLETIRRTKFRPDAEKIAEIVARFAVGAIVFGLPLNMDGTEGPRAQATRAFARNLGTVVLLPILFWDERLSTMAVNRMLIGFNTSRQRRGALVDKMSAAYILQGFLDAIGDAPTSSQDG
jgi:putative Holliday junction resolvase